MVHLDLMEMYKETIKNIEIDLKADEVVDAAFSNKFRVDMFIKLVVKSCLLC